MKQHSNRTFVSSADKAFDKPARAVAIGYYTRKFAANPAKYANCRIIDNPEPFKIDLLILKDDIVVQTIDVECKREWLDRWTFPDVHFPERKRTTLLDAYEKYPDSRSGLFMINKNLTTALYVDGRIVLTSPVNTCIAEGNPEPFCCVPLDNVSEWIDNVYPWALAPKKRKLDYTPKKRNSYDKDDSD
jgi:hypothetical protein